MITEARKAKKREEIESKSRREEKELVNRKEKQ